MLIDDARAEVLDLCQALIRLDTTNPPGRETAAAELLRDHLEAAGVECELVARDPERANLVARLRGSGDGPSLAFVGHTDVVPSDPRDWTHPPFDAVVDGGYLYGRGAVDMKNELARGPLRWPGWRAPASGRRATCGCLRSPTRRTARPTWGCGGCSSNARTSGPTSRSTRATACGCSSPTGAP